MSECKHYYYVTLEFKTRYRKIKKSYITERSPIDLLEFETREKPLEVHIIYSTEISKEQFERHVKNVGGLVFNGYLEALYLENINE